MVAILQRPLPSADSFIRAATRNFISAYAISFSTSRFLRHYSLRDSPTIPPGPSVSCPPPLLHLGFSAGLRLRLLRRATTQTSAPCRNSRSHNARPFVPRRSGPHPEPTRRRLRR